MALVLIPNYTSLSITPEELWLLVIYFHRFFFFLQEAMKEKIYTPLTVESAVDARYIHKRAILTQKYIHIHI